MSTLTVPCPHCTLASNLDSERLPDGPASFACPGCQGKVVVDKRELLRRTTSATGPPPAPAAEAGSTGSADRRFGRLPADAKFPCGIILGEDESSVTQVQEAMATLGSELERIDSAESARELILNEQPEICIYVAGQMTAPPFSPMAPLTGLAPRSRRRLFLALIADNLKTLDGSAAFIYQVNMTIGKPDLPQLGAALYSGIDYHQRLYKPYFLASEPLATRS